PEGLPRPRPQGDERDLGPRDAEPDQGGRRRGRARRRPRLRAGDVLRRRERRSQAGRRDHGGAARSPRPRAGPAVRRREDRNRRDGEGPARGDAQVAARDRDGCRNQRARRPPLERVRRRYGSCRSEEVNPVESDTPLMEPHDDHPHVPGPSLWPVGFAVGIVVLLIGLIVSWWVAGIGAAVALGFAFMWVRDLTAGTALTHVPAVPPESPTGAAIPAPRGGPAMPPSEPGDRYPRSKFLELSTLGLGGVIGGLVTAPALGFMIAPAFLKQGFKDHDVGPLSDFPEGKYVVTTFTSDASQGTVSRRTAFVRYNGDL